MQRKTSKNAASNCTRRMKHEVAQVFAEVFISATLKIKKPNLQNMLE